MSQKLSMLRKKQSSFDTALSSPETTAMPFQPSPVQLARAAALKRYNWLYTYTPLILLALLILSAAGWMIWSTIVAPDLENQQAIRLSALADMVIITTLLPLLMGCLILPLAGIALTVYDRQRERTRIDSLQRLFWRVDGIFEKVRHTVEETTPKVTRPLIKVNSYFAFVRHFLGRLKRILFG